jgi:serine/threonine protein kinase
VANNDGADDPTIDRRRGGAAGPSDLPEGLEVGEYRVLKKIGEGGMGAVYSAVQPVIGKRVAIKVLAPHIATNPELVRRFVDEARAVNKIGHPNIVDIFSFGWLPDQRHYFAMEFLDGQSLAERIKQGRFEPDEARRLFRQICQALEAAHRQGIVHRDLKPDNIWIVQPQHGDSYAKLLDFGIAKLVSDGEGAHRTQTGIVMGTPAYMSPEQCRGVDVGLGTDIYALGMILYELYAGRLPFIGSFAELITHHLTTVPPPPSRYAKAPIPPALDALIARCLDKDPSARPRSAEALGKALEAALPVAGETPASSAAPPSPAAPPVEVPPDTLAPAPGRTTPPLTSLPARDRRPWLWIGGASMAAVAAIALFAGSRREGTGPASAGRDAETTLSGAPPAPAAGRVHIVVNGIDGARVLIDGKLVAEGVRETRVANLAAAQPHRLRVEAPDRTPHERVFTVAADAEAELAVDMAAPAAVAPTRAPPPSAAADRTRKRDRTVSAPPSTAPTPAKARHRDGLVGDDIFDAPR